MVSTDPALHDRVPRCGEAESGRKPADDRIEGGFHVPGHAEAAGIFERSGIIGAFGAKRQ